MQIARAWILLAAALGACVGVPSPDRPAGIVLPRDLAGCYQLHTATNLYYASPRLRLNTDTVPRQTRRVFSDSSASAWTLTRLDAAGGPMDDEHDHGVLFWQRDEEPGHLRVMIHTGHSGTELKLEIPAPNADTLRGSATEHWDFGPPFSNPGGPVSLVRIPCLEEPGSHSDPEQADRSALPPR